MVHLDQIVCIDDYLDKDNKYPFDKCVQFMLFNLKELKDKGMAVNLPVYTEQGEKKDMRLGNSYYDHGIDKPFDDYDKPRRILYTMEDDELLEDLNEASLDEIVKSIRNHLYFYPETRDIKLVTDKETVILSKESIILLYVYGEYLNIGNKPYLNYGAIIMVLNLYVHKNNSVSNKTLVSNLDNLKLDHISKDGLGFLIDLLDAAEYVR